MFELTSKKSANPPVPFVHRGIPASSVSELLPVLHRFLRRSKRTQQTESCSDKVRLSAFDFHIVIFIRVYLSPINEMLRSPSEPESLHTVDERQNG